MIMGGWGSWQSPLVVYIINAHLHILVSPWEIICQNLQLGNRCDDVLWKRILISVHNLKGLKASSETCNVKDGIWSHLTSIDVETSRIRSIVEEGMILSVGSGGSISFWHDKWCDKGPLKRVFPRLYSISSQKNSFIAHMGWRFEECWKWNLNGVDHSSIGKLQNFRN